MSTSININTSSYGRVTNDLKQSGIHRAAYQSFFPATRVDIESAKSIAKRIFETYDVNRQGVIGQGEARSMISDAYYSVNKNFIPHDSDVHEYLKIQDRDKDGKLTLADIERSCIQYLSGVGGTGISLGRPGYHSNMFEKKDKVADLLPSGRIGGNNNATSSVIITTSTVEKKMNR